jgi:hypothetical protein
MLMPSMNRRAIRSSANSLAPLAQREEITANVIADARVHRGGSTQGRPSPAVPEHAD